MKTFCVGKNGKVTVCPEYVVWVNSTYGASVRFIMQKLQEIWGGLSVKQRYNWMIRGSEKHNHE